MQHTPASPGVRVYAWVRHVFVVAERMLLSFPPAFLTMLVRTCSTGSYREGREMFCTKGRFPSLNNNATTQRVRQSKFPPHATNRRAPQEMCFCTFESMANRRCRLFAPDDAKGPQICLALLQPYRCFILPIQPSLTPIRRIVLS
jgi:hypothetical protein